MSDIQRWYIQNPPGQPTEFVAYEDHLATLRACEQRLVVKREGNGELWLDGYGTGYADGEANALSKARAAVRALPPGDGDRIKKQNALAVIDALAATPATGGLITEVSYQPGQYGCVIDGGQ